MRRWWILVSLLLIVTGIHAQTAAINGFCTNGGKSAVVQGLSSTNKLNQIIPSCTVTVYATGTLTPATIYKDAVNTPLSNPFTADSLTATAPGKWLFFAPTGQGYDVVMSGGIPPLTFSAPVTLTDILIGGGGGGGGGCNPIGLNGVLQASNGVGGCTPAYVQVNGTNLVSSIAPNFVDTATVKVVNPGTNQISFNGVSSSPTIQHNDATLAGQFSAGISQLLDFNDSTPAAPAGYVNATFQPDTATGRISAYVPSTSGAYRMLVTAPDANQGVFVPFGSSSCSGSDPALYTYLYCGNSGGAFSSTPGGIFEHVTTASFTWSIPQVPAGLVLGNVTAVYGVSYNSQGGNGTAVSCTSSGSLISSPQNTQATALLSGITGANLSTVTCMATSTQSVLGTYGAANVNLIGLWVEYTGSPVTNPSVLNIAPQLSFNPVTNTLSTNKYYLGGDAALLTAQLPDVNIYKNVIFLVSDLTSLTVGATCTGSGTPATANTGWCISTGGAWTVFGGSGGGGGSVSLTSPGSTLSLSPSPITGTGTLDLNLAHANTWSATQTFSNVKDTGAAAASSTACLQIDTTGLLSNTGTACGAGGGGGTNVKVNSGSALTTANLNSTTPAAGASNKNLVFQVDGSGNTTVEAPYATNSSLGIGECDGTTTFCSGGIISAPSSGPVCNGTVTLSGATISAQTAGTNTPVTCTGLLTTDNIMLDFNGSPLSTNGFIPASGGPITIIKYPSANTINITPVNYNASSVTLGSITLNYRVVRGGGGSGGGSAPSVTFNVATGASASPAGPYVAAPVSGTISNCYFTTLTADGSTNLVFNVKFNGTNILSGTSATITAGDTPGTTHTFSLTSGSITITQGQKWEFDITGGTSSWTGAAQCY